MRKLFAPVFVIVVMFFTACSGQQGSVTAPSPVASAASGAHANLTASSVHANLTAPLVSDACKPPVNSVVFDPNQLGKVTITNDSPCTNDFLYVVWNVSPTDDTNQTLLAAQGAHLAPGERRQLTVNFQQVCGSKYQRDVYIGLSDDRVAYSFSDMHNYFFAALGYYQYSDACTTPPSNPPSNPPSTPPSDVCPNIEGDQASIPAGFAIVNNLCTPINPTVDVCPNLEGNQSSVPQGFTLVDGACVPFVPPPALCTDPTATNFGGALPCTFAPPPVDVCPNLDGAQSTVPAGYTLVGGLCVVVPPTPALCTDSTATNFGLPAPCTYPTPPPPGPSCASIPFSGQTGTTADVPTGAAGRLNYARTLVGFDVVEVHPSHGGTFASNNNLTFTFTPSQNYAVLIFHHMGGGGLDLVFTGVPAGVPLSVPTDGGDVFYFNCPQ